MHEPGRVRRRRVAVTLAGLAVLAVAGVVVAAIALPRPPGPPAAVGGQPTTAAASSGPATDPSRFPVVHESGGGVQNGPTHATIGVPYAFDLHIHCGIQYADFSGIVWQAEHVQPYYRPKQQDWRSMTYASGIMTLVSPDEARFEDPDEGLQVTFRPLTTKRAGCD